MSRIGLPRPYRLVADAVPHPAWIDEDRFDNGFEEINSKDRLRLTSLRGSGWQRGAREEESSKATRGMRRNSKAGAFKTLRTTEIEKLRENRS